ncbi:co-chaperone GroES [bacterium]|nr:co-chaperone GroES [bacterium]MBU1154093.1 co-chaperone GroES [bacterium]MBU2599572.1 co-chaperone GroES [bacterium]
MKIKPLRDKIVIKRVETEEKLKSGLIIPDTAKERPQEGIVIAVGRGRLDKKNNLIPMEVKVNDRVLLSKYSGSEIKIDDEEYLITDQDSILGIIE